MISVCALCFCYLGSSISSYWLGYIAEHFGWAAVLYFLIAFCLSVAVIWCGYKIYSINVKE